MQLSTLIKPCILIFLSCSLPCRANALGILEAYQLALKNDAQYQSEFYEHQAGQQYTAIGRSNLLPNVSANYLRNSNRSLVEFKNLTKSTSEHREYDSEIASIQMRQPLINFEGMARYRLGQAQSSLSDQVFLMHVQDLINRTFNQYVATLYAQDTLKLAESKRNAYLEQKRSNDALFAQGEGTKTDAYETQSKFDVAEVEVIEASVAFNQERHILSTMVGQEVTILDAMNDFSLNNSEQIYPRFTIGKENDLEEWQQIGRNFNPDILAQQQAIKIAQEALNADRAGHLPRLDAVASVSKTDSESTNTFNQEATTRSIGLQLSIPIYSGGLVSAQVTQAAFQLQKAEAELKQKSNEVELEILKQYQSIVSGQQKIAALHHAVFSAQLLLEATKKSLQAGIRTNLDVLNATYQLFQVKREFSLAQYQYLQSYLNLKKAAGQLNIDDLRVVANSFQSSP